MKKLVIFDFVVVNPVGLPLEHLLCRGGRGENGAFLSSCQEQLNLIFDVIGTPSDEELGLLSPADLSMHVGSHSSF
eukprot:6428674-Amphidinium_carterae.1